MRHLNFSILQAKYSHMKVLRFLGILLLILIVGFLVLCLVSPSEVKVEKSTTIDAPKAVVWEQVVYFKNWDNWSPWKEMDTTIVTDISGTDGQEGAKYHYVGKRSGEGVSTNMGVTDGEMKYEMHFLKPIEGKADGWIRVAEEGGKTKATWYFHENLGFLMRGLFALMGGTKMLDQSFSRGLELLKNYSEAHKGDMTAASTQNFEIIETQFAAHNYAGIRKVVKWADMTKFFSDSYAAIGKAAGQRINGPASALYYKWDEPNQQADMMAAFPVSDNKPVEGATMAAIPATNAYMIKYVGGYTGSYNAHMALDKHMEANGKKMSLVIEEYIKGPNDEPDSNKYITNIYYLQQ